MNRPVKRGVMVGCGFFAQNQMHGWAGMDGVEIVAVCDLDEEKARKTAAAFGVARSFTDVGEMLETGSFDFVDIATTGDSHREIVELACDRAGLVICQKPIAETMDDARALVTACETANTPLVIHENFRWQRPFLMMKKMVDEGRIGTPHFSRFSFRHGYDNYVNQPYLATIERFTTIDLGLHLFDLARHFLGEVARISCTNQRINPIVRGEDVFTALLAHEGGATSICDCSFFTRLDPEPFPHTAAWIEGDKGTLELKTDFSLTVHWQGGHELVQTEPSVPAWGERPWHNVQDSVINFQTHARAIMDGQADPQPSGADNLKTLELVMAAYDSAKSGQTIGLSGQEDQL
jgi:predicted dehydrogenase